MNMSYSVWAPVAKEVELIVNDRREPMTREADGWWYAEREPQHGDRYGYLLDGQGPYPDPRSPSQPDGVHGLSEWIDHDSYPWRDRAFRAPPLGAGVIYELHIGTFSEPGTFVGAVKHLDKLVALGVTHVEIMPVAEGPGQRGWGYDGVDLFAPHRAYGGPSGLKQFVDACHERGLAVILDVVYNHLGPDGNYLGLFGPYFTDEYHTPWGSAVNLDGRDALEVRRFLIDNALMWLRDYRIDGLRLDAVHALMDSSAIHFLEELSEAVHDLAATEGRPLCLIAESDLNNPRYVTSIAANGLGLDAQWTDDFHHSVHALLTGERDSYYADFGELAQLAKSLRQGLVYDGRYSKHRGRVVGRPPRGLSGHALISAIQNHDQVGNRAAGDRLHHLVTGDRTKIAAALLLMAPLTPMLFQGEEWAASSPFQYFTDHQDPELGEAVRNGRRKEFAAFGWDPADVPDPQAVATFERSKLNWSERDEFPHSDMLDWYTSLIELRRSVPSLTDGRFERAEVSYDAAEGWLTLQRGDVWLAINLSDEWRKLGWPADGNTWSIALTNGPVDTLPSGINLGPEAVVIARGSDS